MSKISKTQTSAKLAMPFSIQILRAPVFILTPIFLLIHHKNA